MSSAETIIDTNVLSELAKPAPNEAVLTWFRSLPAAATSALVVYEIARGIEGLRAGKRRTFLEGWFAELLEVIEVVPLERASAIAAAQLEVTAKAKGRSIDVRDLFILATAQARSAEIVTRNVDDFRGMGVAVYDPFRDLRM